jgi:S-DNA-T family DNA segregation ATPase FtsK/SpoIIIE
MVSKADGNDNIYHYNKLHPQNKLPMIIIIIDEFIELMVDNTVDDKDTKEIKNNIMKNIRQIGQWGGSLGINYCILHQKPSRELIPIFIKNQSSVRICFGFEDLVCCAIVLGDELAKYAHKLPPRKAYFSNNEYHGYLYTSNLKGRINMFIKDSIKPNHRALFSDLKKLNSNNQMLEIKNTPIEEMEEHLNVQSNLGTVPLPQKSKGNLNISSAITSDNKEVSLIKTEELALPETKTNISYTIPKGEVIFDKVDPIKIIVDKEKLDSNIKNIPDFVPFNPKSQTKVVIDQTKIDFSKTQKPIKNKEDTDNVNKNVINTNRP